MSEAETPLEWVQLARLVRPQGRKGEVLADLTTDFPESLPGRPGLYLAKPDFDGPEGDARACNVQEAWLPKGRNEGRVVLAFAGVDTIEAAEAISGLELLVRAEDRVELDEEASYISDLVGCRVLDGTQEVGTVDEVQFPTTPDGRRRLEDAAPMLVVLDDGEGDAAREMLIPFVRDWLVEFDRVGRVLHMRLPEGLLTLDDLGR